LSLILKKFQKKSCVSAGANFVGSAVMLNDTSEK